MLRRHTELAWAIALTTLLSACALEDSSSAAELVRRDSAGIAIVENPAAAAQAQLDWTLDTVPDFDIGQLEGEAPYELFRVTGVAGLPDGRIVILNGGTQELRFFDGRGTFIESAGGRGDGPGEYQFPRLVPRAAYDTLHIFDSNRRLSFVSTDGAFIRSWTPTGPIGPPVGLIAAGKLVTRDGSASAGPNTPEGIMRDDMAYEIVDLASEAHDTVAEIEGQSLLFSRFEIGGRVALGFTAVPLDVAPSAAVAPNRLYITPGKVSDVLAFDSLGTLRQIFRIVQPTQTVSRAQFDRVVDEVVAQARDEAEAASLRRRYGQMPVPEIMPVFRRLLVDALDHLWVEVFDGEGDQRHEWIVFDPTGRALGRIETPAGVTIDQIGSDFLLGHMRDDADVEHVARYRLVR
jgi:hypothetical protein